MQPLLTLPGPSRLLERGTRNGRFRLRLGDLLLAGNVLVEDGLLALMAALGYSQTLPGLAERGFRSRDILLRRMHIQPGLVG